MALALGLIPVLCFGFGVGFDSPPPAGTHLVGPPAKGTITYSVEVTPDKRNKEPVPDIATIQFDGKCVKTEVHTGAMDFSAFTDEVAFLTASGDAVAASVEEVRLDRESYPTQLGQFTPCYGDAFVGVYVAAVNKTVSKTTTGSTSTWVGEVTIQGFRQ